MARYDGGTVMKEVSRFLCARCLKDNVEVKVWADANTDQVIDDAIFDEEDTWCRDCQDHTGIVLEAKYEVGDGVYWTDSDGRKLSGMYKIISIEKHDGINSIYRISENTQVFEKELS